jgi:SAM-dependent methyltransferase
MMHRIKELLDNLAYPIFLLRKRRPWTPGYYTARKQAIEDAIDSGIFNKASSLPHNYGYRMDERVVEYPWVYSRLPTNPGTVLDAGSALNHLFLLKRRPIADANLTICTLSPEKRCYWNRSISYLFNDLRATCFRDSTFDAVISISTIEHIGLDNTLLYTQDQEKRENNVSGYLEAVREFKRIVKPHGCCYITVPYGKARNHGWFQVFDSAMVQSVIDEFNPVEKEINYFGYFDGWRQVDSDLLKEAAFFDIHRQKKYDNDYAAGARGVACLRLVA